MQDMPLCLFLPLLQEVLVVCVISSSQSYHLWGKILIILNQGQRALRGKGGVKIPPRCQGELFFSNFLSTSWYSTIKENSIFSPVAVDSIAQGSAPGLPTFSVPQLHLHASFCKSRCIEQTFIIWLRNMWETVRKRSFLPLLCFPVLRKTCICLGQVKPDLLTSDVFKIGSLPMISHCRAT